MTIDPRYAGVRERLKGVQRIVAVTGGKGGIGKSLLSSALALVLRERGLATGILDLDLTGPSDHVFLGFPTGFPSEEFGIDPSVHHGIRCMSVTHFSGATPAPLRGGDVTNALLELLAITRWGRLDMLVVDMPPGLGDTLLDAVRLLGRPEFLVVATASRVVLETVRKNLAFLTGLGVPVVGIVENMSRQESGAVRDLAASFGVPFLGAVPFDEDLEDACGDVARLAGTRAVAGLRAAWDAAAR